MFPKTRSALRHAYSMSSMPSDITVTAETKVLSIRVLVWSLLSPSFGSCGHSVNYILTYDDDLLS